MPVPYIDPGTLANIAHSATRRAGPGWPSPVHATHAHKLALQEVTTLCYVIQLVQHPGTFLPWVAQWRYWIINYCYRIQNVLIIIHNIILWTCWSGCVTFLRHSCFRMCGACACLCPLVIVLCIGISTRWPFPATCRARNISHVVLLL